ncbi:MAG: hypothetical protein ACJ77K_05305 [Bacteroidia bacterium]
MNKTSTKKITEPVDTEMKAKIDDQKEFPYVPSDNIINNILNYSKALSVRPNQTGGHFEMVLN